jgi:hypothetical protein
MKMPRSSSNAPGIDAIELLSLQIAPAAKKKGGIKYGSGTHWTWRSS